MKFNFETNIEKRMPDTGNVYMVDRMTSNYALAHPFDVDGFIETVWQKWEGTESRETIRQYFNYGLGRKGEKFSTHCPAKHRDKEVKDPKTGIGQIEFGKWPEHVGGLRPSLIEAWNKGAEYHTKGFCQGDTLPAKLPACKITRLGDDSEWIALFPKDMALLSNDEREPKNQVQAPIEPKEQVQDHAEEPKPKQLSLFDQMQMQIDQLTAENEKLRNTMTEKPARSTKRKRTPLPPIQTETVAIPIEEAIENNNSALKTMVAATASFVAIALLYHTGMLIPIGLAGLLLAGLLK